MYIFKYIIYFEAKKIMSFVAKNYHYESFKSYFTFVEYIFKIKLWFYLNFENWIYFYQYPIFLSDLRSHLAKKKLNFKIIYNQLPNMIRF